MREVEELIWATRLIFRSDDEEFSEISILDISDNTTKRSICLKKSSHLMKKGLILTDRCGTLIRLILEKSRKRKQRF